MLAERCGPIGSSAAKAWAALAELAQPLPTLERPWHLRRMGWLMQDIRAPEDGGIMAWKDRTQMTPCTEAFMPPRLAQQEQGFTA